MNPAGARSRGPRHRATARGGIVPKARILAVDDQRYFRELIEEFLTAEGFETQTASSGEEALHLLERASFDIVLTDLVMPGMDGSELVHRVKSRNPDQDIVVVTGVVDVKTAVDAMKLGATDYLLKPFDRQALGLCLEGILQKRRLQSEHARLLAENIEFMGERRLFERALGLFACVAVQPLAERIVEGLCLETQAQGGVLWVLSGEGDFELAAARGIVRVDAEPEKLDPAQLPAALQRRAHRLAAGAGGPRARGRRAGAAGPAAPRGPPDRRRAAHRPARGRRLRRRRPRLRPEVCAPRRARPRQRAPLRRAREALARGPRQRRLHLPVLRRRGPQRDREGQSIRAHLRPGRARPGTARRAAPRGRRGGRPGPAHGGRGRARAAAARRRPARGGRRAPLPRAALRGGRPGRRRAQAPRARDALPRASSSRASPRPHGRTRSSPPPSTRATAPAWRRCCACSTNASTRLGAAPCAVSAWAA